MKAEYKDGATPGEGVIIISDDPLPAGPWSVALLRGTDRLFLCGNEARPWIGDRAFLSLPGTVQADGTLHLNVGPAVVDQLDSREQYRLTLHGSDGEATGRLRIGQITHSREGGSPPPPEPPTAPPSDEAPQPVNGEARQTDLPLQGEDDRLPPLDQEQAPPPARRKLWRYMLLALLALACVLWYLLDPRKNEEGPVADVPPQKETPASVPDQVRRFFQEGSHSPREAVELAGRLSQSSPEERDAVYRLWYFAAENGEPSAYLPYARILDPTTPPCGSIEKNGAEAWAMYEKARGASAAEAMAAQTKLRQHLEARAAQGDARAREWLGQIAQMR